MLYDYGSIRAAEAIFNKPYDFKNQYPSLDNRTRSLLLNAGQFKKYVDSIDVAGRLKVQKVKAERYMENQLKNLKKMYQAGITIATGTDAGSPGVFHGLSYINELETMQKSGIPAHDIIEMSTKNGALVMGRDDIGTLEKGKVADFLILEKNPSENISNYRTISHVIHLGKLIRDD